ncbi:uncharacterized, partial [Tachysurus ichikawai]
MENLQLAEQNDVSSQLKT